MSYNLFDLVKEVFKTSKTALTAKEIYDKASESRLVDRLSDKDGYSEEYLEKVLAAEVKRISTEYVCVSNNPNTYMLKDRALLTWGPNEEEYKTNLTVAQWKAILLDKFIFPDNYIYSINCFYQNENNGSCTELAYKYLGHYNIIPFRNMMGNVGTRISKKYKIQPWLRKNNKPAYWPIGFQIFEPTNNQAKSIFRLRNELLEAFKSEEVQARVKMLPDDYYVIDPKAKKTVDVEIEETEDMNTAVSYPLNQILYGPPGTGKTYNTVIYAVAICTGQTIENVKEQAKTKEGYKEVLNKYNALKEAGRIAFTTFHQSYGYEEFIEGLKPSIEKEIEPEDEVSSNELNYVITPGVFKKFCDTREQDSFEDVWNVLMTIAKDERHNNVYTFTRRTGSTFEAEIINDNVFRVNWKGKTQSHNDLSKEKIESQYNDPSIYDNSSSLNGGTKMVVAACQAIADELAKLGKHKIGKNKVFIIDEINRGNISKIFGELITLIEDSKREGASEAMSVTLPYSGKPFGVPKNVYILGTMNTADRSIAMMDTALRRRFEFEEMLPKPELLNDVNIEGVNIGDMLRKINERIEFLYDREHTIGHAFFMGLKDNPQREVLAKIFKNKVIPLLQEYFYDDYSKIMLVLGDDNPNKTENEKFIKKNVLNKNVFFSATSSDALEGVNDFVYEINTEALDNIEAYKKIGTKPRKLES